MKTLPEKFTKHGWNFLQKRRVEDVAIFERWKTPDKFHLEVIRIRPHNGFPLPSGERTAPGESYPSDNQWGRDGFTFSGDRMIEESDAKMAALLQSDFR